MGEKWKWWSRIDDHLVLGAAPFATTIEELCDRENLKGVVNMTANWPGPISIYNQYKIQVLQLPTVDYTPPTLEDIVRAVNFIRKIKEEGGTVLVHCKSGRGRAATVVLCYLMAEHGMTRIGAQKYLNRCRPQVSFVANRDVVLQYEESLPARPMPNISFSLDDSALDYDTDEERKPLLL